MPPTQSDEERFQEYRQHIKLIVDNQLAADEAFSNPEVQARALEILDEFHAYATGDSPNKNNLE